MTRGDRLLIGLVALAVVVSVPISAAALAGGGRVAKVTGPAGSTTLDLRHDGTYTVEGRTGDVVVRVADGAVRCLSADCPDRVCVRSGEARIGRPIVCAPNGVTVSVSGARTDERSIDAVSR